VYGLSASQLGVEFGRSGAHRGDVEERAGLLFAVAVRLEKNVPFEGEFFEVALKFGLLASGLFGEFLDLFSVGSNFGFRGGERPTDVIEQNVDRSLGSSDVLRGHLECCSGLCIGASCRRFKRSYGCA
jgi:hypothetical protein